MVKFHMDTFAELLRTAPEPMKLYDSPAHSDYLQREIFDKLGRNETVDLSQIDLTAFDFCHVTPAWYDSHFHEMSCAWQRGLNKIFKLQPAVARDKRAFF